MSNDFVQDSIASRVEEIVRHHVESETPLPLDASLFSDLAIDSLELVELGIGLEKAFGVQLPMNEVRQCSTVKDLILLVQRVKQEGQVGSA